MAELLLDRTRQIRVWRGKSNRSGIAPRCFKCERWAAERADSWRRLLVASDDLRDHLGHAQQRVFLQTLGRAHDYSFVVQVWKHLLKQSAAMLRRHYAHHDLGVLERFSEIVAGRYRRWNDLAGKKLFVHAALSDALANFLFVSPQ